MLSQVPFINNVIGVPRIAKRQLTSLISFIIHLKMLSISTKLLIYIYLFNTAQV